MNKTCKMCPSELPISTKPNKSGFCNKCYRKNNTRKWERENPEKVLAYKCNNLLKIRKTRLARKKERYATDLNFRIRETLRTRLSKAVSRNSKTCSAVDDLGCSIDVFKTYIKSKFKVGMSWDNYGEWHIDHIVALTLFNLQDKEQLLKACHYTNLQPLWAKDNRRKSNK